MSRVSEPLYCEMLSSAVVRRSFFIVRRNFSAGDSHESLFSACRIKCSGQRK